MSQPNNYGSGKKKRRRGGKKNKKYQQYNQQQNNYHQQSHHDEYKQQSQSNDDLMIIDGSMMEGGGQILRNSTAFAALMKRPVHITKIRGKRSTPGLRKQHSKGIELVSKINGGFVEGNFVKSMDMKFWPSATPSYLSTYSTDIETAGSVCLLMQTVLPLMIFSPLQCSLTCIGGTNASFAPQIDWFILILQPMLKRLMNIEIDIQCLQRGFFPKGGGKILLKTNPIEYIPAFDLTKKGQLKQITGSVIIGGRGLGLSIGKDIVKGATRELQARFGKQIPIQINILPKHKIDSFSDGIGVVIVAETDTGCLFGGSSLKGPSKKKGRGGYGKGGYNKGGKGGYGKYNKYGGGGYGNDNQNDKGEDYEEVGRVAARELVSDWNSTKGGCTDRWLQDQLIIFMSLANGKSRFRTCALELHTETAIHIAEIMTGVKFDVTTEKDGTVLIECEGIGYPKMIKKDQKKDQKQKSKTEQKENDNDDKKKANQNDNNNDGNDDNDNNEQRGDYLSNRASLF
eukprot:CAMPEP_0201597018 /NCGR_PEP_ID=MMETSP0190_2-20130828/193593_1 /ASSEMBLY_ACC=CAM_ASM_000263 /TAXON_ID=37353 /ORGANISM="Rosalina sp." /LENGTH=512 /DNA_ID=CAMNT_0048057729 /DNA_START=57 /DNA_END=1595 /DNA_ORIENTATION=+